MRFEREAKAVGFRIPDYADKPEPGNSAPATVKKAGKGKQKQAGGN